MAVPGFQDLTLPLLRIAGDGEQHRVRDAVDTLAGQFSLTDAEREELLGSGRQTKLANRAHWARAYLKGARLVASPSRGVFEITDRGREVLAQPPARIDIRFLEKFPEFVEFRKPKLVDDLALPVSAEIDQTPGDMFVNSYRALREAVASDLLERLRLVSPSFFESLVVDLLVKMGYGGSRRDAGAAIGRSGDGGIDGIIKEDKLGLDLVCIQAKRWEAVVGRPVVQAFAGSLEGVRARKGVLITTSNFSKEAVEYVKSIEKRIVLLSGAELAELMIDYGVGVTEVETFSITQIDEDYFDQDVSPVVIESEETSWS